MPANNNICQGCPAAYALGVYAQEYTDVLHKAESETARRALEEAAGLIDCRETDKQLPALPETVPEVGTDELIDFVAKCPSFEKYVQLRMEADGPPVCGVDLGDSDAN